ncbi:MAG: ABC transporter permease subunit, partial [Acidaminobacteraceae bacterium]
MKLKSHRRFITTMLFVLLFFVSAIALISSTEDLIHKNGLKALKEIVSAMFKPDLSYTILKLAAEAVFQTVAYAAAGITIAIVVGFLLAIPSSEIFKIKKNGINIAKHTLAFMRGIHEIIWAWFFVASIGLTPFSAVLAIAIPYAGTLGKIFSDILRNTNKNPIESLRKSGASNIQQIVYGVIPENFNQLKSYIFYRFECAIRSSAILSFIGLGGLGYQINISLQDLKYAEVWTFVYTLAVVVIAVDFMGKVSRNESSKKLKSISNKVLTLVFIASWAYLIFLEDLSLLKILTLRNLEYSLEFLRKLIGLGSENSPYLDISI